MSVRHASCRCGQLRLAAEGEPARISICHCLACQQRTGSAFSYQARFPRERVTIEGEHAEFGRRSDDGEERTYAFCPTCGTTVFYVCAPQPDLIAVPIGGFADPTFPAPQVSVWESRRHAWVGLPEGIEHRG